MLLALVFVASNVKAVEPIVVVNHSSPEAGSQFCINSPDSYVDIQDTQETVTLPAGTALRYVDASRQLLLGSDSPINRIRCTTRRYADPLRISWICHRFVGNDNSRWDCPCALTNEGRFQLLL
jgi:hypothetical protein